MACPDCNSTAIVFDSRDGSEVCSYCGLVQAHHSALALTDAVDADRPMPTRSVNHDVREVLHKLGIECDGIERCATEFLVEYKAKHAYRGSVKALEVYSIYETLRSFGFVVDAVAVCGHAGYSGDLKKFYSKKTTESAVVKSPMWTRIQGLAADMVKDSRLKMKWMKTACEINEAVRKLPAFAGRKPSKMDCVVMFHASVMLGMKVDKVDMMAKAKVSVTTFNSHLKLLQASLKAHGAQTVVSSSM
jgi:hypothetical protein